MRKKLAVLIAFLSFEALGAQLRGDRWRNNFGPAEKRAGMLDRGQDSASDGKPPNPEDIDETQHGLSSKPISKTPSAPKQTPDETSNRESEEETSSSMSTKTSKNWEETEELPKNPVLVSTLEDAPSTLNTKAPIPNNPSASEATKPTKNSEKTEEPSKPSPLATNPMETTKKAKKYPKPNNNPSAPKTTKPTRTSKPEPSKPTRNPTKPSKPTDTPPKLSKPSSKMTLKTTITSKQTEKPQTPNVVVTKLSESTNLSETKSIKPQTSTIVTAKAPESTSSPTNISTKPQSPINVSTKSPRASNTSATNYTSRQTEKPQTPNVVATKLSESTNLYETKSIKPQTSTIVTGKSPESTGSPANLSTKPQSPFNVTTKAPGPSNTSTANYTRLSSPTKRPPEPITRNSTKPSENITTTAFPRNQTSKKSLYCYSATMYNPDHLMNVSRPINFAMVNGTEMPCVACGLDVIWFNNKSIHYLNYSCLTESGEPLEEGCKHTQDAWGDKHCLCDRVIENTSLACNCPETLADMVLEGWRWCGERTYSDDTPPPPPFNSPLHCYVSTNYNPYHLHKVSHPTNFGTINGTKVPCAACSLEVVRFPNWTINYINYSCITDNSAVGDGGCGASPSTVNSEEKPCFCDDVMNDTDSACNCPDLAGLDPEGWWCGEGPEEEGGGRRTNGTTVQVF